MALILAVWRTLEAGPGGGPGVVAEASDAAGLTLAGINGAILAIAIAGFAGYLLIVFQSIDRMQTELIDVANRVHDLPSHGKFSSAEFPTEGVSSSELSTVYSAITMNFPELTKVELPEDETKRARIVMVCISEMGLSYPFKVEATSLATESGIRNWHGDLQRIAEFFVYGLDAKIDNLRKLAALVDAERNEHGFGHETFAEELRRRGLDPTGLLHDMENSNAITMENFLARMTHAHALARELRLRIESLDRYRARLLPRRWLVFGAITIFVAFVCGVAIPMVHPDVSTIVAAWIPATLYVLLLAGGGLMVVKRS